MHNAEDGGRKMGWTTTWGRGVAAGRKEVRPRPRPTCALQALLRYLVVWACLVWSVSPIAAAANACGALANPYGPFDYSNTLDRQQRLPVVEQHHFTDAVFQLRSGVAGGIASDIDYTLRAFPNHHRALDAMSRLGRQQRTAQPDGSRYAVECWFERALRFAPRDPGVRLVHSIHLHRNGKLDEAIAEARAGLQMDPNHPELHYNLGLYLVQKQDYTAAREHARAAYGFGYPLPGLKQRLERAGQWLEH
jgi:tetratricopeptide (TPR) repeat protein